MITNKPNTVDDYIACFPKEIQVILEQVRATVKQAAPMATEVISYNMPAYKLNGILVYFAAYKNHIGFYPGASGIKKFSKELFEIFPEISTDIITGIGGEAGVVFSEAFASKSKLVNTPFILHLTKLSGKGGAVTAEITKEQPLVPGT